MTIWSFRHLPNVLMVHYNDLLADLAGEMRRVADFVGIQPPPEEWPALVDQAGFETMKRDVDKLLGDLSLPFKDGAATLVYKGTNGRWRGVRARGPRALRTGCR